MKATKQKSIKGLIRQLVKETVYTPARVSEITHSLERVLQNEISDGSTYAELYTNILHIVKEMHMVASASVMQPIQYKIGSSNKFETLKTNYESYQNHYKDVSYGNHKTRWLGHP